MLLENGIYSEKISMKKTEEFKQLHKLFDDYCISNKLDKEKLNIAGEAYNPVNKVIYLLTERSNQKGLPIDKLIESDKPMYIAFEVRKTGVIDRRKELQI